ncbi:MAG: hypothetical protein ACI88A_005160 [Paraglaciecola sp.]
MVDSIISEMRSLPMPFAIFLSPPPVNLSRTNVCRFFGSIIKVLCLSAWIIPYTIAAEIKQVECDTPNTKNAAELFNIKPVTIDALNIIAHPIFDENESDILAIHHFANWLHINTEDEVIKERLPFSVGDSVGEDELAEAERIIRSQPYIRDAKVSLSARCQFDDPTEVEIHTWDNWSMIPTVSFGRKGGNNKFSLGLKEDNLLGMGIRTRFKYNSDEQRNGYQLTIKSATPYIKHSTLLLDFLDNDDGQRTQLVFDKPFYHLRSESMFYAEYLSDEKTEEIFQSGLTRNSFDVKSHHYQLATGWLLDNTIGSNSSSRFKIGVTDEKSTFFVSDTQHENDQIYLPKNRNYRYPWLGFEYLQRNFKVFSDIYLIKQSEDINLGWQYDLKLGLELSDVAPGSDLAYHLMLSTSKGYALNDGLLLLSLKGDGAFNTSNPDQYLLSFNAEYFKRYTPLFGLYSRTSMITSNNQFMDTPVTLGDENGVRGYSLQYQHGEHSVSATAEARFYSGYNLYKILDVGFAAFMDVGKASGGEQAQGNETNSLISSVGVGARLYSSRSSHRSVVHIDLVKPLTSSIYIDSWEWRLQLKQAF